MYILILMYFNAQEFSMSYTDCVDLKTKEKKMVMIHGAHLKTFPKGGYDVVFEFWCSPPYDVIHMCSNKTLDLVPLVPYVHTWF